MTHTAEYRTHDGRTGIVTFESRATIWRNLVRAAKNAVLISSLFDLGCTVLESDIAALKVDGNAA